MQDSLFVRQTGGDPDALEGPGNGEQSLVSGGPQWEVMDLSDNPPCFSTSRASKADPEAT